ncbi:hypothetical protein SAMD00019534_030350 [Acytostelium subglobosum LB1]|uniref:hypothetical protein n=1 Tax=Acytostelium subglobosum LB1 TaxID=1410327 RepID=UPI000644FEFD|nr:hypothetical protein SAMD00019534_030350 [Acytostelium subglobosum LB1]GAM19860.1 hypothetical protein SAMD00019534_030350 [Acytostelium subglobosum LB1]|eukprot:XP_012756622.1 hypothetical protein SAMD00019534_030350 [Acytostelium subglobosum LB1]
MTQTNRKSDCDDGLSQVLKTLLPKSDCRNTCNNNNKQRHESVIAKVLCNRELLKRIVNAGRPRYHTGRSYNYTQLSDVRAYCLENVIKSMPYAVIKHVLDNNRYMMLYNHHSLMRYAVEYGQLDVYKLLQTQARDLPPDAPPPSADDFNYISDHLLLALNVGQPSMFNYLLSLETQQSMNDRILEGDYRFHTDTVCRTSDERVAMSTMLRTLITYIESHYSKDTPIEQYKEAFSRLLGHPFELLLKCQDIELARLAAKYVDFHPQQLYYYCSDIFGPRGSATAPYLPLSKEIDLLELEHTVVFLFELLELYARQVERTSTLLPSCSTVFTKLGVMITDIYLIMSSQHDQPRLLSNLMRAIYANIRLECDDGHLEQLVHFFLDHSLDLDKVHDSGNKHVSLVLNSICTYGTITLVRKAYAWLGLRNINEEDVRLNEAYPKSVEILEYISHTHSWYQMDKMAMLVHFTSMADPDSLKTFLAAHDIQSLFRTNVPEDNQDDDNDDNDDDNDDDDDYQEDSFFDLINSMMSKHDIDTCATIQSIIQTELDKHQIPTVLDIISDRTNEMTVPYYQLFTIDRLKDTKFELRNTWDVDPAVVAYLLAQVPTAVNDSDMVIKYLRSACAIGMTECVQLLDSPSQVFTLLRSHDYSMSELLHEAFKNGHHSICQYLIGCGARFGSSTWKCAGAMDVATLDTLVAMQELTDEQKDEVFDNACSQLNLPLMKVILSRWPDVKLTHMTLNESALSSLVDDRVDVLSCVTELLVKCPPDEYDESSNGSESESESETEPELVIDLAVIKDKILEQAKWRLTFNSERCLRYLLEGLPQQTINKHSTNVWIKYLLQA